MHAHMANTHKNLIFLFLLRFVFVGNHNNQWEQNSSWLFKNKPYWSYTSIIVCIRYLYSMHHAINRMHHCVYFISPLTGFFFVEYKTTDIVRSRQRERWWWSIAFGCRWFSWAVCATENYTTRWVILMDDDAVDPFEYQFGVFIFYKLKNLHKVDTKNKLQLTAMVIRNDTSTTTIQISYLNFHSVISVIIFIHSIALSVWDDVNELSLFDARQRCVDALVRWYTQ